MTTERDVGPDVAALLRALTTAPDRDDPYPVYAQLRRLGPALPGPDGAMVLTGHAGVGAAMREHRLVKDPARVLAAAGVADWQTRPSLAMMFGSLLMLNAPDHTRLRSLVSAAFTARRTAALEPAVDAIVAGLLDDLAGAGPAEFVSAFAFPLPVTVIGELLGIPAADRPMFQQLVHDWAGVLELLSPVAVDVADAAAVQIAAYLDDLATERRARPTDDLMSALVHAEDGGERLSRDELVTMAALLLAAGFETTTGLLSNGLVALMDHPDQLVLLRERPDDRALLESAATELLRYDSPTQVQFGRTATTDLRVGDVDLHAGQRVLSLLGSANRDASVYDDPDVLRLDRSGPAPRSFGGGIHYCLGAPLARLETVVTLRALATRFARIEPAGAPVRRTTLALRGHTSVPVTLA